MVKQKSFSIPLLGVMKHTEETRAILAPYAQDRKQSEFVRRAIIRFADEAGFDHFAFDIVTNVRPEYIPENHWNEIVTKEQKSYGVDYTYAIAFWWLKRKSEYRHYNKSKLVKAIVTGQ